jgi:tetratricopeptide (TPR) repeat protein
VAAPGIECEGRVVWSGPEGAALVSLNTNLGSTLVRWGVVPEGRRTPCTFLTEDRAIRTTIEPVENAADRFSVDTRDIGQDITGAAVLCGDLLLGVALPGSAATVLTSEALLTDTAVQALLTDHGLFGQAAPVGASIPRPHTPEAAHRLLSNIAASPPPPDTEYARITDTCLDLARSLPANVVEAADSADRYGPLHSALDRLIADPNTSVEVFLGLIPTEARTLQAWKADLYTVAARSFATEARLPGVKLWTEPAVKAYRAAVEALLNQGRLAAGSDAVAALRDYLDGLPEEEHDLYRSAEIAALTEHTAYLAGKERYPEALETSDALAAACHTAIDRGVSVDGAVLVTGLAVSATAALLAGHPVQALAFATDAVRVCEELREAAPGSLSSELGRAHMEQAAALRSLRRVDEAAAAEARGREALDHPSEESDGPRDAVMILISRSTLQSSAGQHKEAAETLAEAIRRIRSEGMEDHSPMLGMMLSMRAGALFYSGHTAEALKVSEESAEVARRYSDDALGAGFSLTAVLIQRARALLQTGRARATLTITTEIADLVGERHPGESSHISKVRAENMATRAHTLQRLGRDREALDTIDTALELIADLPASDDIQQWKAGLHNVRDTLEGIPDSGRGHNPDDPLRSGGRLRAVAQDSLGGGRIDLPIGLATEAIEILEPIEGTDPRAREELAWAHHIRADAYNKKGRHASTVVDAQTALRLLRKCAEPTVPGLFEAVLRMLAWGLLRSERWEEAVPVLTESVALRRTALERGDRRALERLAEELSQLARAHSKLGQYREALPYATEAVTLSRKIAEVGNTAPDLSGALLANSLIHLAYPLGMVGDAEAVTVAEEAVRILEGLDEHAPSRDRLLNDASALLDSLRDTDGPAAG